MRVVNLTLLIPLVFLGCSGPSSGPLSLVKTESLPTLEVEKVLPREKMLSDFLAIKRERCRIGDQGGCRYLTDTIAAALPVLERYCFEVPNGIGYCFFTGSLASEERFKQAVALCETMSFKNCWMAAGYEAVQGNRAGMFKYYRFICDHEPVSDHVQLSACEDMGAEMSAAEAEEPAKKCKSGDAKSCITMAGFNEKKPEVVKTYLKSACTYGDKWACSKVAH